MQSQISPVTKGQILHEVLRVIIGAESVTGGCRWLRRAGNGELLFNGYEFQFGKVQKVLEMDGRDGCTAM